MTNPWEAGDETGERSKHQIVPYQASDLMGDYSFLPRTNPGKWIEAQELLCPRARELRCPYINPNSHWLGATRGAGPAWGYFFLPAAKLSTVSEQGGNTGRQPGTVSLSLLFPLSLLSLCIQFYQCLQCPTKSIC